MTVPRLRHCSDALENLRNVIGSPPGCMLYLLAAAEPVGNDKRVLIRLSDCWQQHTLSGLNRNRIVIPVKAERAGHPATSRLRNAHVQTGGAQSICGIFGSGKGTLMTMDLHQSALRQRTDGRSRSAAAP